MRLGIIFPPMFNVYFRNITKNRNIDLEKYLEGISPKSIISHQTIVENFAKRKNIDYIDVSMMFRESVVDYRYSYNLLPKDRSNEIQNYIVDNCDMLIIFIYEPTAQNISLSSLAFKKGIISKFIILGKPLHLPMYDSYHEVTIKKIWHTIEEIGHHEHERIESKILIYQYEELQQPHYTKLYLSVYGNNIDIEIYGTDFFWIESKIKSCIPDDFESNTDLNFRIELGECTLFAFNGYTECHRKENRTTLKEQFDFFKQNNREFIYSSSFGRAPLLRYLSKNQ